MYAYSAAIADGGMTVHSPTLITDHGQVSALHFRTRILATSHMR
jgi:hypothetical protein